ncbi:MAG: hypothetical protein NT147_00105 [Candidatus Aminicenantes bacterium]|nr:hypothetical protein [Candidatus Aminicenantes bacterium]
MVRIPSLKLSAGLCLVLSLSGAIPAPAARQEPGQAERLARLLDRAKNYCLKLERAALDFTCMEMIEEKMFADPGFTTDPVLGVPSAGAQSVSNAERTFARSYANNYVYDYQFVRKGDQKTERRILVEENGRKKNEEGALLSTQAIRVENALFGPIGLLGADWQARHDYKIAGEESQEGDTIVVIEASPKPSLDRPHCFGRVWVREADGSIVKISWDQSSVGNFALIQETAKMFKAEPRLTSITEYGLAKNGLRFPSKDTTEEAYLLNDGIRHIKSRTTILYEKYKFFTVETEIIY